MKRVILSSLYSGIDFEDRQAQMYNRAGLKKDYQYGILSPDGRLQVRHPYDITNLIDFIDEISGRSREDDIEAAVERAIETSNLKYLENGSEYRIDYITLKSARVLTKGNDFSGKILINVEVGLYVPSMPRHLPNRTNEYLDVVISI